MTTLLDGRRLGAEIRQEIADEVTRLTSGGRRPPGLAVVLVGEDPASKVYVASKGQAAADAGLIELTERLAANSTADELRATIQRLNREDQVDGIIVQLPLPGGLPERELMLEIDPDKDVDGLHPMNAGRLWSDEPGFVPCTPYGILELLKHHAIPLAGQHAVIVGRSRLVGKPLAALLLKENCTVTMCHSRTRDLAGECRRADILVGAIGRPAFFGPDHVKHGAVVIDVGINRIEDRELVERLFADHPKKLRAFAKRGSILVGDVDFGRVEPLASAITPVPGGVGPLTVTMLLANTLQAYKRREGLA
ncbi:MAG: bifunctional methylenetetrahydrofolate dehydrogenase/methenyltetrahydrofolate cyclohydrolase FolD [Acidobacteria bacterium]|nr:bifunctional methylenetetrahydrofolate dehydrogenase/methenyltetrahydrofolate cyclohydrolase FolD [Acidobacteriota bacterium]